jgi:hypothetical protein
MSSTYDLVGLADLKAWLELTSPDDDVLLGRLITQVSRATLAVLDRGCLLPTAIVETRDGRDDPEIILRHWPVTAISGLSIDGVTIAPAPPLVAGVPRLSGYLLEPAEIAPPGHMQRLALRGRAFTRGVQNISVRYTAGYRVSAEPAIVPAAAPYEVLAQEPYGDWASDCGVAYANGASLTAVAVAPGAGQYTIAAGVYTFSAADAGADVLIDYGYVPADLGFAAMDWIAELYTYRTRIGQQSKSLGGQETSSFIVKNIPDFVASALQPYRRVILP